MSVKDFHNLSFLPISDFTLNMRTKASSSNMFGGWARFESSVGQSSGSWRVLNSKGIVNSSGRIKAGTYYFEIKAVGTRDSPTDDISTASILFDQGELIAGSRITNFQMDRRSGGVLHPRILRFSSDTNLDFSQDLSVTDVFITPYYVTDSATRDFNKLRYLPNDENDDIRRFFHDLTYNSNFWGVSVSLAMSPNDSKVVAQSPETIGKYPPDGVVDDDTEFGVWRVYSCSQCIDPAGDNEQNTIIDPFDSRMTSGFSSPRGSTELGSSVVPFRDSYPPISTFGAENRVVSYRSRISDFREYNKDSNNPLAVNEFIPSFRKPVSRFVDQVGFVNFTSGSGFTGTSYSTNVFGSIHGDFTIENWTWYADSSAMLFTVKIYGDPRREFKVGFINKNTGIYDSMLIGYGQPTILAPASEKNEFSITSTDGQNLGRFHLSVIGLP
jgi:hypothetical protein